MAVLLTGASVIAICGCSRRPVQEINDVTALTEALLPHENTRIYASVESEKLGKDLARALVEVKEQDGRMFPNYERSREMLTAVMTEASYVAALISQRKDEEQRGSALAAQDQARVAIEELKTEIRKARGKMTKAELESFDAQVQDLENSLSSNGMQSMPLYMGITMNARTVQQKAADLSMQVRTASQR
jgi:hypothetical protein